jgi:C4-type Zn-finger protein
VLTQEQREKYVNDKGVHCPYCGSTNIKTVGGRDNFRASENTVWEKVECWDCNYGWTDVYTLNIITGIEEDLTDI